jgi:hypothetical protein
MPFFLDSEHLPNMPMTFNYREHTQTMNLGLFYGAFTELLTYFVV